MLTGPNPTHPEYLRQIECVQRYRDAKIKYEQNLYRYRMKSLIHKGLAERTQAHSTYYQRIRDARERHSSAVSKQFYAIQHDRFKTDELSPHHIIAFPTRRSQQIAHQTAYNQEVSIMAGVAKYVGFPAAPSLLGARPAELDDDLEKMGVSHIHIHKFGQLLTAGYRFLSNLALRHHGTPRRYLHGLPCLPCLLTPSVRLLKKHS